MEIMLDLETLGVRESAIVVSIGAVAFDWDGFTSDPFSVRLNTKDQSEKGRSIDESTVSWWMRQDEKARAVFNEPPQCNASALARFSVLVENCGPYGVSGIWACGPDFDCVILRSLYATYNLAAPFHFSEQRCYRTLRALRPDIVRDSEATHSAVDDAVSQARHAIKIGQALGL